MVNACTVIDRKNPNNFRGFHLVGVICGTSSVAAATASIVALRIPIRASHKPFEPNLAPVLTAMQSESYARAENNEIKEQSSPKCSTNAPAALPGIAVRLTPKSCVSLFVQVKRDFTSLFSRDACPAQLMHACNSLLKWRKLQWDL